MRPGAGFGGRARSEADGGPPRHRLADPAPGQPAHHRGHGQAARACAWSAWSLPSTSTATPRPGSAPAGARRPRCARARSTRPARCRFRRRRPGARRRRSRQPARGAGCIRVGTIALYHAGPVFRTCGAVGRLAERVLHQRVQFRELGKHADGLRTLAGKDEGERFGHGAAPAGSENGTGMIRAMGWRRLYRPVCSRRRGRLPRSIADERRAPGETAAESLEQHAAGRGGCAQPTAVSRASGIEAAEVLP